LFSNKFRWLKLFNSHAATAAQALHVYGNCIYKWAAGQVRSELQRKGAQLSQHGSEIPLELLVYIKCIDDK